MAAEYIKWTIDHYQKNKEECDLFLANLEDWTDIPTVNSVPLDSMKDGCLARFYGMVQDVMNPEYFYSKYNVKNLNSGDIEIRSGKYRDLLPCADSEDIQENEDVQNQQIRHPLFCIPIPGWNTWAQSCQTVKNQEPVNSTSSGIKRSFEEDEDKMDVDVERKMPTNERSKNTVPSTTYDNEKYFPLAERGGLACIVKHYGEEEEVLVNNRIEAVGFLSLSPALEASWQDCDAEDKALHPPPSLVPRLHAVQIRKMKHFNPLLPSNPTSSGIDFALIRSDLHTVLTQLLFGDTLAAEYLLCHLLSTVYTRKDGLALGGLSLNLFNILDLPSYPKMLYDFIQTLVPASSYMPLSVDLLNTTAFVPRKDYETNKLWSGRLQLADDTHLVIDEMSMSAGRLNEAGLRNMSSLHNLALRQELRYEFTYFQLDFHTNIPVLIISEGKSMIPTDVVLKIQPEAGTTTAIKETFEAAKFFVSGPRLNDVRKYLSLLKLEDFEWKETEFIGTSWADLRQQHAYLKQDDLHRFFVLSRLLALSSGRKALDKSDWDKAVHMESERRKRMS